MPRIPERGEHLGHRVVDQDVAVGEEQNLRTAVFTRAVPAAAPELPAEFWKATQVLTVPVASVARCASVFVGSLRPASKFFRNAEPGWVNWSGKRGGGNELFTSGLDSFFYRTGKTLLRDAWYPTVAIGFAQAIW